MMPFLIELLLFDIHFNHKIVVQLTSHLIRDLDDHASTMPPTGRHGPF